MLNRFVNWLFKRSTLPYLMVLLLDCIIVLSSGLVTTIVVKGWMYTGVHLWQLVSTLFFYLIFYLAGFVSLRTYRGVIRYSSFIDLYKIACANAIAYVLIFALRHINIGVDDVFLPISAKAHFFIVIVATLGMWMLRVLIKLVYDRLFSTERTVPVFIYGIKQGGVGLAKNFSNEEPKKFSVKGFVSDESDMLGKLLMGHKVYANDEHLVTNMKKAGVKAFAVSPLKQKDFTANQKLIDELIEANIRIIIADQSYTWDGKSELHGARVRDVQIEDLLPRDEIEVDMDKISELLQGKRVLITGSAGSIGSEIVRQVATAGAEQLILIDAAETPQHDILLMMKNEFPGVKAEVFVESICGKERMEDIFSHYKPEYVFHAAAYKHVPMMEINPFEAVANNIYGTKVIADLSVKYGVKTLVMISTDKAVNPTNVMGCSKRICEIYVQSLDKAIKEGKVSGTTQFVTTRFGNVLGSNGSVIPLFKEQIKNGGPVTVTDPNITRFFMLIPEACKLVLEAGTMGKGGEIFVFDMGRPVKISDLAKRMISLSGASVEIKYTGLRDGEKLYEEVLNEEENTKPTINKKIKIADVREYDFAAVLSDINDLIAISYEFDEMKTVAKMKQIVPEYKSRHSKYEVLDGEGENVKVEN